MMGNYLVRFLGGDGGASLPTYPVRTRMKEMVSIISVSFFSKKTNRIFGREREAR